MNSTAAKDHPVATRALDRARDDVRVAVIEALRADVDRLRGPGRDKPGHRNAATFGALRRAILVGSFAADTWDAYSDVDLLCVIDDSGVAGGGLANLTVKDFPDFTAKGKRDMDLILVTESRFRSRMNDPVFALTVEGGIEL